MGKRVPRKDLGGEESHSDQLRRHILALTEDDILLRPVYAMRHLLRISERLDRLENPAMRHKPLTEWPD